MNRVILFFNKIKKKKKKKTGKKPKKKILKKKTVLRKKKQSKKAFIRAAFPHCCKQTDKLPFYSFGLSIFQELPGITSV